VGVSSPVAKSGEIHTMAMEGNVMKMREVDGGLEVKPGQKITMQPGNGYHIMLMGLSRRSRRAKGPGAHLREGRQDRGDLQRRRPRPQRRARMT
jgi:hypothetical protein